MKFTTYTPQVQKTAGGDAKVVVPHNIGAAGMLTARGINALNQGLGAVNNLLFKRAADADKTTATAANNEYTQRLNDLLYNDKVGLLHTQMKGADGITSVFEEKEKKIREEVAKKYKYNFEAGRQEFDAMASRTYAQRLTSVQNHMYAESKKYRDVTFSNAIDNQARFAAENYSDAAMVNDAMAGALAHVDNYYAGQGTEVVQQQRRRIAGQIAGTLVSTAISKNDMAGAETIMSKYGRFLLQEQLITYTKAIREYKKKNQEIANTDRLYLKHGKDIRGAFAEIDSSAGNVIIPEAGSLAEKAMAAAKYVELKSKGHVPAALVYGQWAHESNNFTSRLALENLNLGGLTQTAPNGEDNKQPDGANYYKKYNSIQEYAEDYIKSFVDYYDYDGSNIKTASDWANILKANGYYTDDAGRYAAGIERGMRGYNPDAVRTNDLVLIQKQKEDYLARLRLENQIESAEKDAAFNGALEAYLTAGANADPQAISRKFGGTNIILTQTIADRLSKMKYGDGKTDRGPVAMDSIASMLMQDESFNSKTDLVAYMQNNRFSNKEIEKAMKWWDQRKNGEGIFAYPHLDEYIAAQLQAEGNKGNVIRKIELRDFANDYISAFRSDKKRNPTTQELQDALSEKVTNTKMVIWSGEGQKVVFSPIDLTRRNIVSADVVKYKDENGEEKFVPGVKLRLRDADNPYRGKEVLVPFDEFSQLLGQQSANPWFGADSNQDYETNDLNSGS